LSAATPPNAIVFGSGYVTIPQMVRGGIGLNIIGIIITVAVTYLLVLPFSGVQVDVIIEWAMNALK
jgi:sodium-dependent dicarboxylate transporter 2/3/5